MKGFDLRPLKKWLQKGEIEEIAKETGIHPTQATNIIKGKSLHVDFVSRFLERVEKNKALKDKVDLLSTI